MTHLSVATALVGVGFHGLFAHFRMPLQDNYYLWKGIGYAGMALFFSRFFVQWLYSEKHKESKIPVAFWWQSLFGSVLMLAYSLRQKDSVYIIGYLVTVIPYIRNLILIYRKPRVPAEGFAPVVVEPPARREEPAVQPAAYRTRQVLPAIAVAPARA